LTAGASVKNHGPEAGWMSTPLVWLLLI